MYTIELTERARRDTENIYEWIAHRSPDGADRWYATFREPLEGLKTNPLSRALAPESPEFDREIRQDLFHTRKGRTYRMLYTVEEQRVLILTVRGPGQPLVRSDDLAA